MCPEKRTFIVFLFAVTAACGGGGGGGGGGSAPDGSGGALGGDPSLVVNAAEIVVPGPECANGGVRIDSGIDENGNGVLDADEVDDTAVVCNGADGSTALAELQSVAPGAACTAGGTRVLAGNDDDGDGILDSAEVDSTTVICAGADGSRGSDGTSALVKLEAIDAGATCPFGGTRVLSGTDDDGDGVLDAGEVDTSTDLCSTALASFDGLVFRADKTLDTLEELWRTTETGEPVKLGAPEEITGSITSMRRSPGGNLVSFEMRDSNASPPRLFVVDLLRDAPPVDVSGEFVASGAVSFGSSRWSPDGSQLAFLADKDTLGQKELYTVLSDGTGIARVSRLTSATSNVTSFEWAPDSSRIAYTADQDTDGKGELYTVAPNGSSLAKVNGPLVAGGDILPGRFKWAPDASLLAYLADQETNGVDELYTAAPDGSNNSKVSGVMVSGGDVRSEFAWAPDSSRLAYRADQDVDAVFELYTVQPDGSDLVKVNQALGSNSDVFDFAWAPDTSRIAYRADETNDVVELYTVAPRGTDRAKVNGPLTAGGNVFTDYAWAPDSTGIAYTADQETNGVVELYAAAPDGSGNVRLNPELSSIGMDVDFFVWAPDGSRIAYRADQDTNDVRELYTVAPDASGNVKVSGPMVSGGDVGGFSWAPDGSRLAYLADQEADFVGELFIAAPDGSGNVKVNGDLPVGGDVTFFLW